MDNIQTKLDTLTETVWRMNKTKKDIEEGLNTQVRDTQHCAGDHPKPQEDNQRQVQGA